MADWAPLRSWLLVAGLSLGGAGLLSGCDQSSAGIEIGSAVNLLATTQGELSEQAQKKLLSHGRQALPYLEAALHTATPAGRRNLAIGLRRLGLAETAPLLGHLAAFDGDHATAYEAAKTLSLWASEKGQRAEAAAQALRKVDEVRGTGTLLLDAQ